VAFSSGYVVVVSTSVEELGREQFCAKIFDNELYGVAHFPKLNLMAACGDTRVVKVVDIHDWNISKSFVVEESECLDALSWSDSGKQLIVSSRNGCMFTFQVMFGKGSASTPSSVFTDIVSPLPFQGGNVFLTFCFNCSV
jgi:hypothetical protein